MTTRKQMNLGRVVRIPGVGRMIRVAHDLPGGALIVEYFQSSTSRRADAPRDIRLRPSETAGLVGSGRRA